MLNLTFFVILNLIFCHSELDSESTLQKQGVKVNAYIYIMSNKKDGTLYIGVTNDLIRRVYEHKEAVVDGFTKRYNLKTLVYFELFESIDEAIKREKQLKNWKREWKVDLIEKVNRAWEDLYDELVANGY